MKYFKIIESNAFWKGATYTAFLFQIVAMYDSSAKIQSFLSTVIGFAGVFFLGYFVRETENNA
jgi:hypothetical protein